MARARYKTVKLDPDTADMLQRAVRAHALHEDDRVTYSGVVRELIGFWLYWSGASADTDRYVRYGPDKTEGGQ